MSYEIYRYIFYGGAILAVILLIVSIILFFVLKIPKVIGDLSGATAKKAIENIRSQNENSGEKTYRSSIVNRERGKLTDKISASGRIQKYITAQTSAMHTEKITTGYTEETAVLPEHSQETTILDTSINETEVLSSFTNETMGLNTVSQMNETTLLQPEEEKFNFFIEYEITYIHTNEYI